MLSSDHFLQRTTNAKDISLPFLAAVLYILPYCCCNRTWLESHISHSSSLCALALAKLVVVRSGSWSVLAKAWHGLWHLVIHDHEPTRLGKDGDMAARQERRKSWLKCNLNRWNIGEIKKDGLWFAPVLQPIRPLRILPWRQEQPRFFLRTVRNDFLMS